MKQDNLFHRFITESKGKSFLISKCPLLSTIIIVHYYQPPRGTSSGKMGPKRVNALKCGQRWFLIMGFWQSIYCKPYRLGKPSLTQSLTAHFSCFESFISFTCFLQLDIKPQFQFSPWLWLHLDLTCLSDFLLTLFLIWFCTYTLGPYLGNFYSNTHLSFLSCIFVYKHKPAALTYLPWSCLLYWVIS